jgi:hypothetical protein
MKNRFTALVLASFGLLSANAFAECTPWSPVTSYFGAHQFHLEPGESKTICVDFRNTPNENWYALSFQVTLPSQCDASGCRLGNMMKNKNFDMHIRDATSDTPGRWITNINSDMYGVVFDDHLVEVTIKLDSSARRAQDGEIRKYGGYMGVPQ